MAVRYNQFATSPSPAAGGTTALATNASPVNVSTTAQPNVGNVLTATSGTDADWAAPSGLSHDPTVRSASFTAQVGKIHVVSATLTVTMPAGPVDGDIVGVQAINNGSPDISFSAGGTSFFTAYQSATAMYFRGRNLSLLWRYSSIFSGWVEIGGSWSSLLGGSLGPVANTFLATDASANSVRISPGSDTLIGRSGSNPLAPLSLLNGDSVLGRVEGGQLQELRPYNVGHNLYSDSFTTSNTDTGSQAAWMSSVAGYRAPFIAWEGSADLIVRGMDAASASDNFRQDKLILNNTAELGANTFKNIVWSMEDTGAINVYRVRHSGSVPSTGFSEYIQAPGEAVVLRYGWGGRWWLSALPPSGRIDRKLATTSATPAIIHTFTTRTNSRVISYKVQVEALETVGTPGRAALYDIAALFHRDGAGTVVQKGATAFLATIEDNAAWDVTFTISGTTIQMKVTGDGTDTVQWRVVGNITEHG